MGCKKCSAVGEPFYGLHPFITISGYSNVSGVMRGKVEKAHLAPELEANRDKIHRVNHVRLSQARLDPATCRMSDKHVMGATLKPISSGLFPSGIQSVCRINVTPLREPVECEDASPSCGTVSQQECIDGDFLHHMNACEKTCRFCEGCVDKHRNCKQWSSEGQCRSNSGYMLDQCQHSCKLCTRYYESEPPMFTTLWNGLLLRTVGFGTAGLGADTEEAVLQALEAGYTHIDSAQGRQWYREDSTAKALARSGKLRDDIFITTKIHPQDLGYQPTMSAFENSLTAFNTDYLDLVLLHYAACFGSLCANQPQGTWRESWRALEDAVTAGRILAIGVSNFNLEQLVELVQFAHIPPAVVQRRNDVFEQDVAVRHFCTQLGIQYVAYSSLGTQHTHSGGENPVLHSSCLQAIAQEKGVSVPQVVLKYALGSGQVVIPRSKSLAHMKESLELDTLQFSSKELKLLVSLDGRLRK